MVVGGIKGPRDQRGCRDAAEGVQDSLARGQSASGSANGLQAMNPYSMSVPSGAASAPAAQSNIPKVSQRHCFDQITVLFMTDHTRQGIVNHTGV